MKIVVIGGCGLIGSQLVERLREAGDTVAASPDTRSTRSPRPDPESGSAARGRLTHDNREGVRAALALALPPDSR